MSQYRFHRRFALEGVTVVDVQDATEQGRRYGFEILSSEKSFAVYAGTSSSLSRFLHVADLVGAETLTEKLDWIDEIRGASAELMSDRRTLQREADSEAALRRDRRISLPVSATVPNLRFLASPPPTPKAYVPPILGFIPPTPSDERGRQLTDTPGLFDQAFQFPTEDVALDSPALEGEGRTRRWSDMAPSAAAQALSEALPVEPVIEYRVIENYSAPVWVPDSKADRCMCCSAQFGVLRRRHHCRLCGTVVCWSCSTKVSSRFIALPHRC